MKVKKFDFWFGVSVFLRDYFKVFFVIIVVVFRVYVGGD